jgi:hypothetical protein
MLENGCYWWSVYGDFPPEDEREHAPSASHVLESYRIAAHVKFPQLAEEMHLSVEMLRRIFHQGDGLDSIQRRRILGMRLAVPPELLGLDHLHWKTNTRDTCWWTLEGYHAFSMGEDGYPRPGEVVRWYRKQKRKRLLNGERVPWTQEDLGEASVPNLSGETVNKMEKHGIGLDSMARRKALTFLLGIPPALLGLDALKHEKVTPDLPRPTLLLSKALTPDILLGYEQHQTALFAEYYTNHGQGTVGEVHWWISYLQDRVLSLIQSNQQHIQVRSIEWSYHRLITDIAREQQDYGMALFQANTSVAIAEEMGDPEYLTVALCIRAATLREQGPLFYHAAQVDLDRALALVKQAAQDRHPLAPAVVGTVTSAAGIVQSFTAQLKHEREEVKALLRQSESLSQRAVGEVDTHRLKFDPGFYHIKAAMALTAWHNPVTLKEHLDEATRLTGPALQRRHLIIQIVRAQGELLDAKNSSRLEQDKHYAEATALATDALPIAKKLNSRLNRDRIQQIYNALSESPYGEEPSVAHLGLLLQHWP